VFGNLRDSQMARHHFVPQFLLRNWATKGRFVAYHFEPGAIRVIENANALVASACQIPNLNTYFGVGASQRDFPEVGFFTPRVDTSAAKALQTMLASGVRALTPEQRADWARLLVSFAVRTPEMLREMGPAETRKAFKLVEASAKGPPDDERKVTAIIAQNMPKFMRNFPLNAAMEICTDPVKLAKLTAMEWWIRRWPKSGILIGDRPVITHPLVAYPCGIPLDNPSCLVALPIAPNAVFFASAHQKTKDKMRRMAPGKIARVLNEQTILRSTIVYAADKSLASFVIPRVQGKATGTWQPSTL
jgi:hypothetical protein